MIRAVKINLRLATDSKQRRLESLRREIISCTQAYIDSCWEKSGRLNAVTQKRITSGSLSYRHRSNCLKNALEIIDKIRKAAKALGRRESRPYIKGAIALSSLVANIEPGKGSFDYVLKISGLSKGNRIIIPFKSHSRLNHWLSKPGAKLLQGCILGHGWAALWIEIPDQSPKEGKTLAVDVGLNKLLVDSNGTKYGTELKEVVARVRRSKPGSKGRLKATRARTDYINKEVKKLPWKELGVIGIENLKNLKKGKKSNRSKKFRKLIAPWTYRQAITRIELLAQENRVRLVSVDPRNTSRQCPSCGNVAKENRRGEFFQCSKCNYSSDSDFVGALNVLARTLGNSHKSMVSVLTCDSEINHGNKKIIYDQIRQEE